MPPRIEEEEDDDDAVTTASSTAPSSPLLSSCRDVVLVHSSLSLIPLDNEEENVNKNANTIATPLTIQDKLRWTLQIASQQRSQLLQDTVEQKEQQVLPLLDQDGNNMPSSSSSSSSSASAPLLDACLFSLQDTASTLIEQAERLVETMDSPTTIMNRLSSSLLSLSHSSSMSSFSSNMTVGRIRASLAVRRALQYLVTIRIALEFSDEREDLDRMLQLFLDQVVVSRNDDCGVNDCDNNDSDSENDVQGVNSNNNNNSNNIINNSSKRRAFRISPWFHSMSSRRLAFDIMVGETATWSNRNFNLCVDPLWQVKAEDLLSRRPRRQDEDLDVNNQTWTVPTTSCVVSIVKVTDRGNGQALVKLRVAPLVHPTPNEQMMMKKKKKTRVVWGPVVAENDNNKKKKDDDVHQHPVTATTAASTTAMQRRKFRVQEARIVQLNADPPTPKVNVDLYESSIYGDCDTHVSLLVQTYPTRISTTSNQEEEEEEIPNLHMELILTYDE